MDIENELKKWSSIKFNGEMRYRKEDVIAFAEYYHSLQLQQTGVIKTLPSSEYIWVMARSESDRRIFIEWFEKYR